MRVIEAIAEIGHPRQTFLGDIGLEESIVWLEAPESLPFVRVSFVHVAHRTNMPRRCLRGHNYRVVGYATLSPHARRNLVARYWRRVFTVRDYDGGWVPTEAVDPLTLAPGVDGQVTARCGSRS
jgi:hypothetical protein